MLAQKLNIDEFDKTTEQLNKMIQDLLDKLNQSVHVILFLPVHVNRFVFDIGKYFIEYYRLMADGARSKSNFHKNLKNN